MTQDRTKYPVMLFPHSDRIHIYEEKDMKLLASRGMRARPYVSPDGRHCWEMWLPFPEGSPELKARQANSAPIKRT